MGYLKGVYKQRHEWSDIFYLHENGKENRNTEISWISDRHSSHFEITDVNKWQKGLGGKRYRSDGRCDSPSAISTVSWTPCSGVVCCLEKGCYAWDSSQD